MGILVLLRDCTDYTINGNHPIIHEAERLLSLFQKQNNTAKEEILVQLARIVNQDPVLFSCIHAQEIFSAFQEDEGFLLTLANAHFTAERVEEAFQLVIRLFQMGVRREFGIRLMIRCWAELGRLEEGYTFLSAHPEFLNRWPRLIAITAGLCHSLNRKQEANRLGSLVAGMCSPKIREIVAASNRRQEALLSLTPEARRSKASEDADVYAEPVRQKDSWNQYACEFAATTTRYQAGSRLVMHRLHQGYRRALAYNPAIRTIINFGCLYGEMEAGFAKDHPEILVIGYDRSPIAKQLNRQRFVAPNLVYLDGHLEEAIRPFQDRGPILLSHTRTASLMWPDELEALYMACRELGIDHILCMEECNFNLETGRFPDFSPPAPKTTLLGGYMLNHDYEHYLAMAGYQLYERRWELPVCELGERINGDSMITEIIHATASRC